MCCQCGAFLVWFHVQGCSKVQGLRVCKSTEVCRAWGSRGVYVDLLKPTLPRVSFGAIWVYGWLRVGGLFKVQAPSKRGRT